jgi:methylenetetrahydrofolate dehydrogenase (NADP+) / methenyltetrahydrofolate cyclohydrolase
MPATVLDGKALAARIRAELKLETERLAAEGIAPGLAVVLVGDDPASQIYVRNKTTACAQAGIKTFDHRLPATTSTGELLGLVASLNADPLVDGILIQLPLPAGIDARRVLFAVDPGKDVDGIHPENVGRLLMGEPRFVACTPFGVMKLIEEARLPLAGAQAVVVGRSNMVGKPMAALLLAADATVTVCHSKTRDLAAVTDAPTCWWPRSVARRWSAAIGSSRARSSSTSASTAPRRASCWATSSTLLPPRAPPPSPPSRAASAR